MKFRLITYLELSPDDRTVACAALDLCVHRWETFPWRQEEYAEARRQKSEVRSQSEFKDRLRRYARRYWRERLDMELNGAEGESAEPRVIQVPIDRALFAKRDPRATANQIDLTDFYTGELGETFHGKVGFVEDHDDDLSELPIGRMKLDGVEFDIRGVIQLRRTEPLGGPWELAASDAPCGSMGSPSNRKPHGSIFCSERSCRKRRERSSEGWSCTMPTAKPSRWTSSMAGTSVIGGMTRPKPTPR